MTGSTESRRGASRTLRFDGLSDVPKTVELWLPHNETTELVALRTDALIEPVPADGRRVWVHHGSSISHGSDASSPTAIWPALAAADGGVELVNLGFAGSSFLQPFVARTIRDTPAGLISLKLGINIVNTDSLRLRSFTPAVHGFLDTIRDGHPDTPLLVISPSSARSTSTPPVPPAGTCPPSPKATSASPPPAPRRKLPPANSHSR
jgi:hypothetical protein